MWIGILVLAWFIWHAIEGAGSQAKTEARRAAANWSQGLQGRLNDGWDKGPLGSGWFWAALGQRFLHAVTGGRNGGGRTQLPPSTPWRRIAGAGWTRGRVHAGQARRRLQASQAAGTFTPAAALAELLAMLAMLAAAATLVTPHRRPQSGRRTRVRRPTHGGFETGFCDDCHRMYAANALRMVHRELRGTEGWWLLCGTCRGEFKPEEPGHGDRPASEIPSGNPEQAPPRPAAVPLPQGWSRREDGFPETPADIRYFDLRDDLGWSQEQPDLPEVCAACGNPGGSEFGPLVTYRELVPGRRGQAAYTGETHLIHQGHFEDESTGYYGEPHGPAIEQRLAELAAQPRPYLLTVTRLDGSAVTPDSPATQITLPIWSEEDLDNRLEQISQDPALEASVAVPVAARPRLDEITGYLQPGPDSLEEPRILTVRRADGAPLSPSMPDVIAVTVWSEEDLDRRLTLISETPGLEATVEPFNDDGGEVPFGAWGQLSDQHQPSAGPNEGEPGDMTTGTVAVSGGDAFTHGQFNAAVVDIHHRLDQVPGQTDEMLAGLGTAEAGRDQVHGVVELGANIATFQQMVVSMFTKVNFSEMGIVEGYAAAGGVDNAPKPSYLAET